jgi:hypothetical protein
MPVAIRNEDTEKFDLKTLPGGTVTLRKMSYGQILERRALTKLTFSTQGKGRSSSVAGEIAMADRAVNLFEFRCCVVGHNLERVEGQLLDLTNPNDVIALDPRVGQEIEKLIEDMNNFEGDDDTENSKGESTPQSS